MPVWRLLEGGRGIQAWRGLWVVGNVLLRATRSTPRDEVDSSCVKCSFFHCFFVCRRNTITHFCFVWLRIFPRYGKYWFLLAKARKNAVFFHNSGKFWVKQSSMSYCLFLPHKAICYDPSHGLSKKNLPWAEQKITHGRSQIKVLSLAAEHMACNK